jgi:hypothetical protein
MNERHGFLRSRDGTFITIDAPGSYFTNALGVNRRGEIVGRFCTGPVPTSMLPCQGNPHHGFLLSRNAAFTTIDFPGTVNFPPAPSAPPAPFPGPFRTDAWGINNRGEIVGGYQDTHSKWHVYRLREGQFTTIDFPDAVDTALDTGKGGINSRGDIVSSYCVLVDPSTGQCLYEHAFLLSHGKFTTTMDFPATMGSPGGHVTANFGINARGDIVGTYNYANGTAHGFLLKLEERDRDDD